MSIAKRLTLCNWMRLRGTQQLRLESKVYAVVARHESDPDRSNFLGKTALVEAFRFAYFGKHRHRTEDEWITKGESEGSVGVEHDDGFFVARSRVRGKSTKLSAGWSDARVPPATGDEAQALIERYLGLTLRDFDASAFLNERGIAKMVLADPADRMAVVEAWLELAPLKAAEAYVSLQLGQAATEVDCVAQEILGVARRRSTIRTSEQLLLDIQGAENRIIIARNAGKLASADVRSARDLRASMGKVEEHARLRAEGQELLSGSNAPPSNLAAREVDHVQANALFHEASRDEQAKRKLAMAEFDGVCPVAGIACPAREEINGRAVENAAMHAEAHLRLAESKVKLQAVVERLEYARKLAAGEASRVARVDAIQKRMVALEAEVDADQGELRVVVDQEGAQRRVTTAAVESAEAQLTLRRAHDDLDLHASLDQQRDAMVQRLEAAEKVLATWREAALVLGPRGAQRAVAEPFLSSIEDGANEALAEAGVGLKVAIQWEHEGKDAAKSCAACGHPFPATLRAKQCAKCGEARGKNLVNRLDFDFSNRSAGAEDMWGIALQLAACAWLRAGRHASLESAFLDEPLAHCDRAHRRMMTKAFVTMLGRFGIRQAFVIMHSADVAAFPGVITITGRHDGTSTVEVTS